MKGMKDNKIEKERNLVLKHVTLYSVYCRDDTEKAERKREKREREVVRDTVEGTHYNRGCRLCLPPAQQHPSEW
jgi:hypothetical protein